MERKSLVERNRIRKLRRARRIHRYITAARDAVSVGVSMGVAFVAVWFFIGVLCG